MFIDGDADTPTSDASPTRAGSAAPGEIPVVAGEGTVRPHGGTGRTAVGGVHVASAE